MVQINCLSPVWYLPIPECWLIISRVQIWTFFRRATYMISWQKASLINTEIEKQIEIGVCIHSIVYIFAVCQCEDCEYADMSIPHANDEYYEMKTKMKLNPLIPRTGIITFFTFCAYGYRFNAGFPKSSHITFYACRKQMKCKRCWFAISQTAKSVEDVQRDKKTDMVRAQRVPTVAWKMYSVKLWSGTLWKTIMKENIEIIHYNNLRATQTHLW